MFFQTFWHWELSFSARTWFCVLYRYNVMMSNQISVFFFTNAELMRVQPSFISNLLRQELCMMSSSNSLIQNFFIIISLQQVGINKLSHFNVVCDNINWQCLSFSDSNELISSYVFGITWVLHWNGIVCISATIESSNNWKTGIQALIMGEVVKSDATWLLIEQGGHCKCFSVRCVILEFVEQECIPVCLLQVEVRIYITPRFHTLENVFIQSNLWS